ncbi:MAG: TonB-dependent receptor plug domain-containing protein, partial [Campylobacteraceae bacterium]|nr:TonB-dependent receptor plug domain-containing protein [Campylobacteraceae bacterium]
MYFSSKRITLLVLGIFVSGVLAEDNAIELTQIEVKAHTEEGNASGKGKTVLDKDYIQNAPSATNSITDLLRGKSYIQYDQTSRSSATGGEISPPKVSINGAKHYENSFLINGVSNNNNINPSGLSIDYASAQIN